MTQESPEVKPKANAARPPSFWRRFGMQFGIWSVGLVMWLAFVVAAPGSFTHKEIYLAFAATTPIFALMAIPLTLVVITGEIDLSFPSIMALSTCAFAKTVSGGAPIIVGVLAAVLMGLACGFINGFLVTAFNIPSLVITIGTQFLFLGLELAWTNGSGADLTDGKFNVINKILVGRSFFGIANQFWWTIFATGVLWFLLNRTKFGSHVFLTGDNKISAQLMGVNVNRVKPWCFALVGICAALAGMTGSFEVSYFWPTMGSGLLLSAIASVFLGGTSVFGGTGTVTGTFVGAFIIGAINAGIVASGINAFYTQVFFGLVIIASVLLQAIISRRVKK
jgi:simple sugar transport system permease protein